MVPHAIWRCQVVTRWSRVVPGRCRGVARWFWGAKRMLWKVEENGFFCSLAPIGVSFSGIVCNLTPYYDGLVRKVLQGDNLAPFSSDKI